MKTRPADLRPSVVFTLLLSAVSSAGCSAPGGPGSVSDPRFFPGDGGRSSVDAPAGVVAARCLPAQAEPLPARASVRSGAAAAPGGETRMFASDLFGRFRSHCGGCHVDTALGGFQVRPSTFARVVDRPVLALMRHEDPAKVMPPPASGGKPFSQRPPGDPVVELAALLELWIDQGRGDELVVGRADTQASEASYLMTEEVGRRLTSLGDCLPEPGLYGAGSPGMGAAAGDRMVELDQRFAHASELPDNLADTDLFTLDGETLARQAVVAFAPAYPLWADNAAKIRHIRVPRGESVKFDRVEQRFAIPPNTRFYKTFLKRVIDKEGQESFRKIETRLILSRPDRQLPDGSAEPAALYGTYVWNAEETEAHLLRDPLRNGKPFVDRLLTYTVDEPKLEEVRAAMPRNLPFTLDNEHPGVRRRYAIPSGERCVQCHMGSPEGSFVLGFTPLQIARRPAGEGGILEAPHPDELDQLQRLIDYGVISGMTSPADVLPLERSQGGRAPRNEHELRAQGYMLGACANCHNPRGFPSVKSPELKDALDMWPSDRGGVFQFPLERMSPLRKRGFDQDVPMPYITPSLREYPVAAEPTTNWTPKWTDCASQPPWVACRTRGGKQRLLHIDAPWRSLLYRNVDAPYTYVDDFVVFPRMPMHGAGFDCRLPRIMGDWMVSIPAVRKNPAIGEDAVPGTGAEVDREPQPYREVGPDEPGHQEAVAAAAARLEAYHAGGRYDYCPDTGDIVDLAIRGNRGDPLVPPAEDIFDPGDHEVIQMPAIGVPVRPHWVITDLTDPGGPWFPRRPDWAKVLVEGLTLVDPELSAERSAALLRERKMVIDALETVTLTEEIRKFALERLPFGLWQARPECQLDDVPRVDAFQGAQRPRWMRRQKPPGSAPVYTQAPGEAVFNTICVNCHGPRADSKGLMSEAIMLMTGGEARVANFRDGLFGPADQPGGNRARVFDPKQTGGVLPDDMGARYLAWMALGGTERRLPPAILNIVASTRVLGEGRPGNKINPVGSANMLELARELCTHALPAFSEQSIELDFGLTSGSVLDWGDRTGLIDKNLDAEMWQRLCAIGNRKVVRVPYVDWSAENPRLGILASKSLYFADAYPPGAKVMDHEGRIQDGIRPDNLFPLCVQRPPSGQQAIADKYLAEHPVGGPGGAIIPYCPDELFAAAPLKPDDPPGTVRRRWQLESEYLDGRFILHDVQRWAIRGAINAGLVVFLYLDALERGQVQPEPPFNKCEERKRPG